MLAGNLIGILAGGLLLRPSSLIKSNRLSCCVYNNFNGLLITSVKIGSLIPIYKLLTLICVIPSFLPARRSTLVNKPKPSILLSFIVRPNGIDDIFKSHQRRNIFETKMGNEGVKLRQCVEMYLEVRCSNNDAVILYENLGYIVKQRLRSYYRDGEDAYLMVIEFSNQD